MKKLLIGLFAASALAASAAGYAGSVTFMNMYNQPVMFIVSLGPVYNPIAEGTVPAGGQYTYPINGPITRDLYFFASPLNQPLTTLNCGRTYGVMDNVIMKAGWTQFGPYGWSDTYGYDGSFSCRLFAPGEGVYNGGRAVYPRGYGAYPRGYGYSAYPRGYGYGVRPYRPYRTYY